MLIIEEVDNGFWFRIRNEYWLFLFIISSESEKISEYSVPGIVVKLLVVV